MKTSYQKFLDDLKFNKNFDLVKNIYRFGSPYNFSQRTKYIKEQIMPDKDYRDFLKTYSVHGWFPTTFSLLHKMESPVLMNILFTLFYFYQRKLIKKA